MRGLFFKLFFAFWAIAILSLAIGMTYSITQQDAPPHHRLREVQRHDRREMKRMLSHYGKQASSASVEEQKEIAEQLKNAFHLKVLRVDRLVTPDNPLPPVGQKLLRRAQEDGRPQFSLEEKQLWAALPTRGRLPAVVGMREVPEHHVSLLPDIRRFLHHLTRRLPVELVVSGLICWFFAARLTSPMRRLRTATRRLAAGDWSVRVASDIGNRGDEIGALAQDFDRMAEDLANHSISQQRLFRDISHELRSPLARLNVALELVRQQGGESQKPLIDRIEQESERMNTLIGEILNLSQLESGIDTIRKERVDLEKLVQLVVNDADFEAQKTDRSVAILNSEPVEIKGAPTLLHRAIENVVRNAARYTDERTQVQVSLEKEGEAGALVRVRDFGPGIPEEDLGRVFDAFYRVGTARDRETGGYGIGLALAQRAARLHGGYIEAVNEECGGLCVSIHLNHGDSE